MPEYVRVRDKDTGHERSVFESEVPHGNYEVLDEAAVEDRTALPLPSKFAARKSTPVVAPESLSSKSSGQQADTKKENAHG